MRLARMQNAEGSNGYRVAIAPVAVLAREVEADADLVLLTRVLGEDRRGTRSAPVRPKEQLFARPSIDLVPLSIFYRRFP